MGSSRHAGSFSPGLALSGRSFAGLTVRGQRLAPKGSAHLLVVLDGQAESVTAEVHSLARLLEKLKPIGASDDAETADEVEVSEAE